MSTSNKYIFKQVCLLIAKILIIKRNKTKSSKSRIQLKDHINVFETIVLLNILDKTMHSNIRYSSSNNNKWWDDIMIK